MYKHFTWIIILLSLWHIPKFKAQEAGIGSLGSFNFMNCMDFARHMTSTAERFGLLTSAATGEAAAAAAARRRRIDEDFVRGVLPLKLINRMFRQAAAAVPPGLGPAGGTGVLDTFQGLFSSILNIGDSNISACNNRPKWVACQNVDNFLSNMFPDWWFNLKVTDNANFVVGQVTNNRFLALFESAMKAYKCFCQC